MLTSNTLFLTWIFFIILVFISVTFIEKMERKNEKPVKSVKENKTRNRRFTYEDYNFELEQTLRIKRY